MKHKDRGIVKWRAASFLPEQVSSLNDLLTDYYSIEKPILDEDQVEELENKLKDALEYAVLVKVTTWEDGYKWEYCGKVKGLDAFSSTINLELSNEDKYTMKIKFDEIIRVDILTE